MFKHPWDKWFRRKQFCLVRGRHYTCQPHSMAQQVRTAALKRSLSISIRIAEGTIFVVYVVKTKRKKR